MSPGRLFGGVIVSTALAPLPVTHVTQHHQAGTGLPPLPSPSASPGEPADAVEARLLARVGVAPSLDDYRRAYASCGVPWPGDDEIRQLHPVAS